MTREMMVSEDYSYIPESCYEASFGVLATSLHFRTLTYYTPSRLGGVLRINVSTFGSANKCNGISPVLGLMCDISTGPFILI